MPLYLTEKDVTDLFTMSDALDVVERVFMAQATGDATNESRRRVRAGGTTLNVMSGALSTGGGGGYLGHKAYTVSKAGAKFFFSLYSAETGDLLAFIEADRLGQIRTGAASGVATRYLSRKDSATAAIYGSGWQAQSQLSAICHVRSIREVRVYSRKAENRERFCADMRQQLKLDNIRAVDRPEEAAEGADIVATITTSREPVLSGEWLKAGTHINAAGGNSLLRREIDDETLRRAAIITVDSIEQARLESGELVAAIEKGVVNWERVREIRQVASGEVSRTSDDQITVFKSLGLAIEDVAAAALIYRRAVERQAGREF